MAENETNQAAQEQDSSQEQASEGVEIGQKGPVGYAPSKVESTRVRMQGGGMGQSDLMQQGDPTQDNGTEKY